MCLSLLKVTYFFKAHFSCVQQKTNFNVTKIVIIIILGNSMKQF
jgi:hypothetical protein